jgi:hypothetical protein
VFGGLAVDAHVPGLGSARIAHQAQVQRFAGALASSSYEVVATKLPFDITSEGTLTGDIGGGESNEAPRFTITLARRLP